MPKNRFAQPDVTRYPLSDGEDWVEFRNGIDFAEWLRLSAETVQHLAAFLAAWSFENEGQVVEISREAIEALSPETGQELIQLLNKHLDAQEQPKNSPGSTPE